METGSRKKHFSTLTLSVFEFMARMLYYLPDHQPEGNPLLWAVCSQLPQKKD